MAISDKQRRALRAKLSYRHVKTRSSNGVSVAYIEGWHAIAEANRIFGHDSWDRQTQSPTCVWGETQRGQTVCLYSTKVRITVRAGGTVTVREGIGTGFGRSPSVELAHEIAVKTAETDATKRALATFGNPFGLALYDKEQAQVTKPRGPASADKARDRTPATAPDRLILRHPGQPDARFGDANAFVAAMTKAIADLTSVEAVYAFWEANVAGLAALRSHTREGAGDPVAAIVAALKQRARALAPASQSANAPPPVAISGPQVSPPASTPASLAIPKERRLRDKAHLAFVASQPCLVCGRRPAQAHHLKFAQSRSMGLKVSDEYTLPLCTIHHDELHRTGDERAWWARHGTIEPLKLAARLWAASSRAEQQTDPATLLDPGEAAAPLPGGQATGQHNGTASS